MTATTKHKRKMAKPTRTEETEDRWFRLPHGSVSSIGWSLFNRVFVALTIIVLFLKAGSLAASLANDFVHAFLPGSSAGAVIVGCVTVASLVALAIWLIRVWK